MTTYPSSSSGENHWDRHAAGWDLIGPPLRPSPDDLAVVAAAVTERFAHVGGRGLETLILGVTPELARLPWPPESSVVALERSESMIRHVWPGTTAASERVVQGDWLAHGPPVGLFDLVLGDGVLSQLDYPGDYERFCQALAGVTRPGGFWVLRLYARPVVPEDPEMVLADVRAGRLTNINEFKLRLGMALCEAHRTDNVAVAEMWRYWDRARRQYSALQDAWSADLTSTIENYREGSASYTFPRLDPVLEILRGFGTIRQVSFPEYPFGACCPTVLLEA